MSDGTIKSDHPLTKQQRRICDALLDLVIPPDEELGMPGAGELGLLDPGGAAALQGAASALVAPLEEIVEASGPLASLTPQAGQDILQQVASHAASAFQQFVMQALVLYYRHDEVMKALGLEPGPPFPRGNTIEPGDLSLLDPVRKRKGLYRE